jgi:McrBC 5-methylcytosine restriction system component
LALTEHSITLIERGSPVVIPEAEWQTFGFDDLCDTLHAHGVIGMKRVGGFRLLEPRHYVGELRSRGRSLRILPKVEGLLESLRSFVAKVPATLVSAHEDWQPSKAAEQADPARALLNALEEVLATGIPATYDRSVVTTSHPRGRILFNETVGELLSHGIRHKARCEHSTRHGDYSLGAVLDTVVRMLAIEVSLPPLLRFKIERLVELFEVDTQTFSVEEALARGTGST